MTEISKRKQITVNSAINAPVETVWNSFTDPHHIERWNNASPDWHTPRAENDLREGGRFLYRMEARDGSMGFDFSGQYNKTDKYKFIEYTLDDSRKVQITFISKGGMTEVVEIFEAETENPVEMQRAGWQAILDNFKRHVEELVK